MVWSLIIKLEDPWRRDIALALADTNFIYSAAALISNLDDLYNANKTDKRGFDCVQLLDMIAWSYSVGLMRAAEDDAPALVFYSKWHVVEVEDMKQLKSSIGRSTANISIFYSFTSIRQLNFNTPEYDNIFRETIDDLVNQNGDHVEYPITAIDKNITKTGRAKKLELAINKTLEFVKSGKPYPTVEEEPIAITEVHTLSKLLKRWDNTAAVTEEPATVTPILARAYGRDILQHTTPVTYRVQTNRPISGFLDTSAEATPDITNRAEFVDIVATNNPITLGLLSQLQLAVSGTRVERGVPENELEAIRDEEEDIDEETEDEEEDIDEETEDDEDN